MSILTIIILLLFLFWLASNAVSWWQSVNTNYPINDAPVVHVSLKLVLLVVFLPVFLAIGLFLLTGLMFKK